MEDYEEEELWRTIGALALLIERLEDLRKRQDPRGEQ